MKQAKKVPFSVIALGAPLFDLEAVDDADVFVTFAGSADSIGAWTPYSWFPEQSATKFAAIVSGALTEEVQSTTSAFLAWLKGSVGEGPNRTNYCDQSSVKIPAKFRNLR